MSIMLLDKIKQIYNSDTNLNSYLLRTNMYDVGETEGTEPPSISMNMKLKSQNKIPQVIYDHIKYLMLELRFKTLPKVIYK
jgi:hypothetical protein